MRQMPADGIEKCRLPDPRRTHEVPHARPLQQRVCDFRAAVGQCLYADSCLVECRHRWGHVVVGNEFGEAVEDVVDGLPINLAQFLLEQERQVRRSDIAERSVIARDLLRDRIAQERREPNFQIMTVEPRGRQTGSELSSEKRVSTTSKATDFTGGMLSRSCISSLFIGLYAFLVGSGTGAAVDAAWWIFSATTEIHTQVA